MLVKNRQGVATVTGNPELGAVLRDLRKSRHLTLATVARHAGCAESLVSYVESGDRQLHPWLAAKLDELYRTGGVVAALMRATHGPTPTTGGPWHPRVRYSWWSCPEEVHQCRFPGENYWPRLASESPVARCTVSLNAPSMACPSMT